jgi:hypothetical protein
MFHDHLFRFGLRSSVSIVLGPEVLERGAEVVRVAGFFGVDWRVESEKFVWAK